MPSGWCPGGRPGSGGGTGQGRAGEASARFEAESPDCPLGGEKTVHPLPRPLSRWMVRGISAGGSRVPSRVRTAAVALLAQRPGQPGLQCQQQRVPLLDSVAARASTTSSRTTTATAAAGKRHRRGKAIACNDQAAMTIVVVMMITSSSVLFIGPLHRTAPSDCSIGMLHRDAPSGCSIRMLDRAGRSGFWIRLLDRAAASRPGGEDARRSLGSCGGSRMGRPRTPQGAAFCQSLELTGQQRLRQRPQPAGATTNAAGLWHSGVSTAHRWRRSPASSHDIPNGYQLREIPSAFGIMQPLNRRNEWYVLPLIAFIA
jgi:hypothetical protein